MKELAGRDVLLDIVDQHRAARRQRRAHLLELEAEVPRGMHAVVYEKVDLTEIGDEARQQLSA